MKKNLMIVLLCFFFVGCNNTNIEEDFKNEVDDILYEKWENMEITITPAPTDTPELQKQYISVIKSGLPNNFFHYDVKGNVKHEIKVEDASIKVDTNADGTYQLDIYIQGEIISINDRYACVSYRLYDSENYIVSDGEIFIYDMKAGDKFKNPYHRIYEIEAGTYRLELLDHREKW